MRITEEMLEREAYRLIRIEARRFDRTSTDSELGNYVRGVVDLQTQFNRVESEEVMEGTSNES